ncbi:hypothetical protein KEM60_01189 [Austwickia sp. TVS 96-490-7B]|nr:hypothetical protein [Austwickia sp. TVS 96-490-7B]
MSRSTIGCASNSSQVHENGASTIPSTVNRQVAVSIRGGTNAMSIRKKSCCGVRSGETSGTSTPAGSCGSRCAGTGNDTGEGGPVVREVTTNTAPDVSSAAAPPIANVRRSTTAAPGRTGTTCAATVSPPEGSGTCSHGRASRYTAAWHNPHITTAHPAGTKDNGSTVERHATAPTPAPPSTAKPAAA